MTDLSNYERVEVAGVLRNRGDGWDVYDQGGHIPIGIASVENNDEEIIVHFSDQISAVVTFIAVPDETYAVKHGLSCGASVNTNLAKIKCKRTGYGGAWNPNYMDEHWGNIWIYGLFLRNISNE